MRIGQDVNNLVDSNDMYVTWLALPAKIQIEIIFDPNIDSWNLSLFFASLSKFIRKQPTNQHSVCSVLIY